MAAMVEEQMRSIPSTGYPRNGGPSGGPPHPILRGGGGYERSDSPTHPILEIQMFLGGVRGVTCAKENGILTGMEPGHSLCGRHVCLRGPTDQRFTPPRRSMLHLVGVVSIPEEQAIAIRF